MQDTLLVTKHVVTQSTGYWVPGLLVILLVVGLVVWRRTRADPSPPAATRPTGAPPPNER